MNIKSKDRIILTTEESAFIEELLELYQKLIKNTIYNTLGSVYRYLAEEAISEVYLLMCKKIHILKEHECPKAWIIVAARHTAQGMMEKHKTDLNAVSIDDVFGEIRKTDVFEEAVYAIWLENKITEQLIANLTPREREIYRKLYIENKKTNEIAQELDITPNAVRNIHKKLRDRIKNDINQKKFKEFY